MLNLILQKKFDMSKYPTYKNNGDKLWSYEAQTDKILSKKIRQVSSTVTWNQCIASLWFDFSDLIYFFVYGGINLTYCKEKWVLKLVIIVLYRVVNDALRSLYAILESYIINVWREDIIKDINYIKAWQQDAFCHRP